MKSQQKETNIFFSLFSSKDNDEIDSDSLEDFIQKLIEKNEPLVKIKTFFSIPLKKTFRI